MIPRVLLVVLVLSLGACSHSPESTLRSSYDQTLAAKLAAILDAAPAETATAALVMDADTGAVYFERESRRLMQPASNLKLISVAAAMDELWHAEVETMISRSERDGHTAWQLWSRGDPFFSSDDLADLVARLPRPKAQPVSASLGPEMFKGPNWGEGWMWDDAGEPSMPYFSSLALNGNLEEVESNGQRQRRAVADPRTFALKLFRQALVSRGFVLTDEIPDIETPGEPLAIHRRAWRDIFRRTLKDSDNLGAEALARGRKGNLPPLDEKAARLRMAQYLISLGAEATHFHCVDGSGASHYNLVTAELLGRVLLDMHRRYPGLDGFAGLLPVAGMDGTLKSRMKTSAARGRIFAKTGTLRGVAALSGYALRPDGRVLVFVFMTQHFVGPARPHRLLQDQLAEVLVTH